MASNCRARSPTQTQKYFKDFKTDTSESLSRLLDTPPMTLNIMISTCHVRDEIRLGLSQRYTDRMEEHPNILAIKRMKKVKTTRRLKKLVYLIVL